MGLHVRAGCRELQLFSVNGWVGTSLAQRHELKNLQLIGTHQALSEPDCSELCQTKLGHSPCCWLVVTVALTASSGRGSGHRALAGDSPALALGSSPSMARGQLGSAAGEGKSLFGSDKWCCSPQAKMELELLFLPPRLRKWEPWLLGCFPLPRLGMAQF